MNHLGRLGSWLGAHDGQGLRNAVRYLLWPEVEVRPPPRKQPRCAVQECLGLHANTHLHANDREGLERLCRYGARGALALTRLSRAEDGRIAWRMKRALPDGTWHLYFTGLELIRRMASLIPPPRVNLTRYHGVFAPGAKLGPWVRPGQQQQPEPEASQAKAAAAAPGAGEHASKRPPRLDWAGLLRRTFELDVFACRRCGGRRRVLAYVTAGQGVRAILEHLGLPSQPPRLAPAQGPPQSAWC